MASGFDGKDATNPFVKAYQEKFGKDPATSPPSPDMVKLLARYSRLTSGREIAQAIASVRDYPSVLGSVTAVAEQGYFSPSKDAQGGTCVRRAEVRRDRSIAVRYFAMVRVSG